MNAIRRLLPIVVVVGGTLLGARPAAAQFGPGYTGIAPTIGLGNIGGASIAFGGRFEHGIKPIPDLGKGTLSFAASVDFYSWSATSFGYTASYKYIPFGATANWNFALASNPKIDPFLGLGLGYSVVNCSVNGVGTCSSSSGIYFIGRAGMRYFLKPQTALYADLGAGAATVNVGVMFSKD